MDNKTMIISISVAKDKVDTIKELDNLLEKLNISRSSFFIHNARNFVEKYSSLPI